MSSFSFGKCVKRFLQKKNHQNSKKDLAITEYLVHSFPVT